jgi:hypothetical protein
MAEGGGGKSARAPSLASASSRSTADAIIAVKVVRLFSMLPRVFEK